MEPNDQIVISYSATLNASAVVGDAGNSNESKLTYGENGKFSTTPSKTTTYTWAFDVLKIGDSDQNKPLENAQFVVLNHDASKVAKFTAEGKFDGWVNLPNFNNNEKWADTSVLTTNKQGNIHVKGLDSGNYKLREVKAPDGYNMLKEDKNVAIVKTMAENKLTLSCTPVTVEVNNQSGTLLPSTGGMGTTIFYVLGGILAVVLLHFGLVSDGLLPAMAALDPDAAPAAFYGANLLLLAASLCVGFPVLRDGLTGLRGRPSADTMPALAAAAVWRRWACSLPCWAAG